MITDIVISKLATTTGIQDTYPVRPLYAAPAEKPFITVESSIATIWALSQPTGWYDGTVKIYVEALTYAQCKAIAQLVQDALDGFVDEGDEYAIRHMRMQENEDVAQAVDEFDKPYFIASLQFVADVEKLA